MCYMMELFETVTERRMPVAVGTHCAVLVSEALTEACPPHLFMPQILL